MVVRPYAVLSQPAPATVFGRLSSAGSRVELVVEPRQHEALGRCYAVDFRVRAISPDDAAGAEQRLRDLHACIVASRVDAATRVWTGTMWLPVQNVGIGTFRLLEEAPAGMAPAWVVLEHGWAHVRLRPRHGPIDGFLFSLVHSLRSHAIDAEVLVADLEDAQHMERVRALDALAAPLLA